MAARPLDRDWTATMASACQQIMLKKVSFSSSGQWARAIGVHMIGTASTEEKAAARFDKFLAQEEVWIRKGVEARRTRNEGRVRRLEALRNARAARRDRLGDVSLAVDTGDKSGQMVAELTDVSKRYGDKVVVRDFSTRILRGDACANQAYVIGNSLGMQCHTEMTPEMIESWCEDWAAENADPSLPSVQEPAEMRAQLDENMRALRVLSNRLYAMWIEGLPLQQK